MKQLNVALVYDRVNKIGGAERVLLALHEIWPNAPLFTAVYDKDRAKWAHVFQVHPSFVQFAPFAKHHHELYPWLTPIAFESFSFDEFDVVVSVTSAEAKNIITKPHTMHVCYCLTPTRYLWSGSRQYQENPNIGLPNWISSLGLALWQKTLERWDLIASSRPDVYIAISNVVAQRVKQYYKRDVDRIIYPPVDCVNNWEARLEDTSVGDYFLVVSRLVPYKRIDQIIDACKQLGSSLVIVGEGREKNSLMKRAGNQSSIRFVGAVSDQQLASYYKECRAYISAAQEDFGIAAVEAQFYGKPVISYKNSGVAEIVIPGKTGLLYEEQSVMSLLSALKDFDSKCYDRFSCVRNAQRFFKKRFKCEMKDTVEQLYNTYRTYL